ncbi:MAG TPA: hypothetical protein VG326_15730 [Tepidisphaeraceae bacterium]|jgi:hypothetical protein|nr:hypothetical protein [Tepidisphaeraceae bacterium]
MLFGRQKNMVRRANRPYEDYHRDHRRKGLDRTAMLESRTNPRRKPLLVRIIGAIFGRRR